MADKTTTGSLVQQDIPVKWHDNGDSTYSLVVFNGGASGGGGTTVTSTPVAAATATLASVPGSVTSVTLIALNTARLGASVVNESTSILYIKYGATASATSYNYVLGPAVGGVGTVWEMPPSPRYTGIITGIWVAANGNARVDELTA